MGSRFNKVIYGGFLIFGLAMVGGLPSITMAATASVTAGCTDTAKCVGGAGFVDDATGVGGSGVVATTTITAGDTVHWHVGTSAHTATSEAALGSITAAPCGTGDSFDSGFSGPLFFPGGTYDHAFATAGTCNYYCQIHNALM